MNHQTGIALSGPILKFEHPTPEPPYYCAGEPSAVRPGVPRVPKNMPCEFTSALTGLGSPVEFLLRGYLVAYAIDVLECF
jgi:hypothetical protein